MLLVIIRTITQQGVRMDAFTAGTLAGAGSFRCETCGFGIALHERDEIPACPHCHGGRFRRASIFEDHNDLEPIVCHEVETPEWLEDARDALVGNGDYVAFQEDDRVRVVALQEGWTRIGRSLAAHIRFDDPTVSRRHAQSNIAALVTVQISLRRGRRAVLKVNLTNPTRCFAGLFVKAVVAKRSRCPHGSWFL